MALIHRLFQHSRDKRRSTWGCGGSKKDHNFESPEVLTSYKCWQAPVLEEKQIRLLIFKECDVKGKKVVVDSKGIHKVNQQGSETPCSKLSKCTLSSKIDGKTAEKQTSPSNIVDGYQFSRPGSDVKMLGEMLFGSIPMSSNGPMIKVHTFKVPPKLMLSRVFLLKPPKEHLENDGGDKDTISLSCADISIPRSISANSLPAVEIARSMPIAMPPSPAGSGLDDESGEFSASGSFLSPFPPSSPGSSVSSSASNSSLHRRWLRNQVTSMEHMVRRRSTENINNSSTEEPIRPRKRYPKIGVAILISLPEAPPGKEDQTFRRFFFSHFSLLESHFQRLVSAIERALIFQRKAFIRPVMEALEHFKLTVTQLFTAPRIQRPIWLNLMTYPQQRGQLCNHLIRELASLLEVHNSKQNNFFMSRLMTGVLMHHLAWVPTVMPAGSTPSRAFLDKHSSATLDMLAKSHPYNPLWAQLGDMYGTIGLPNRIAKTIVVGKRAEVVCKLLYVLSYFIRCSEVHEINEKCDDTIAELTAKFALTASTDHPDCHRTMTEESVLAKTEDSGIEDVCLLHSELSGKPIFYIQDPGKPMATETSSDDGVGLESEALCEEGAVKQLQRIQQSKCNNNCSAKTTRDAICQLKGFDESNEVFQSRAEVNSSVISQMVEIDSRTSRDVCAKVQSRNEKNAGETENAPAIACKKLDTSMLTSKLEVAVPVGRAARNIDDFLRFDVDESSRPKPEAKTSNLVDVLPCRTLKEGTVETIQNSAQSRVRENSLLVDESGSSSGTTTKTLSETDTDSNNSSPSKVHKEASDFHDIRRTCQRTKELDSASPNQLACNQCACTSNASPATTTNSHTSSACQNLLPSAIQPLQRTRLGSLEGSGHYERTDKFDLFHRSVSSMSAVSCASSNFSQLSDHTCLDHEEIPLASSEQVFELELEKTKSHVDSFGRSLLGGYCQHFVPDFALQGVPHLDPKSVEKNLLDSAQHPVLDDAMSEAVYIIADTDSWSVEVVTSERYQGAGEKPIRQDVVTSNLILELLESVMLLQRMKLSSDFCLMHLEDRLQELYFQSTSVASYLDNKPMVKAKALAGVVGVDCSDLPLLLAVASVHSPHIIANVMRETIEQQRGLALQQDTP